MPQCVDAASATAGVRQLPPHLVRLLNVQAEEHAAALRVVR
jgi:hypothetical protein